MIHHTTQNAKVTAHLVSGVEGGPVNNFSLSTDRTIFLVKFSAEVMARERKLGLA
jgi:hypothetical protein